METPPRCPISRLPLACAALLAGASLAPAAAQAQAPVSVAVAVDPQNVLAPIAPDFLGLSVGIDFAPRNSSGGYYFNRNNRSLVNLFHTMGVRVLRLGPSGPPLTPDENDSLLGFAKAANVRLLYGLNIPAPGDSAAQRAATAASDAATIDYIETRYPGIVQSYSFGNEPNTPYGEPTGGPVIVGAHTDAIYLKYQGDWLDLFHAVLADLKLPAPPKFYGPSTTPAAENWAINFSNYLVAHPDVGAHVDQISQHEYPFGGGQPGSLRTGAAAYGPSGPNPTAEQALSFARARMVRDNDSKYAGLWDNAKAPAGDPAAFTGSFFIPYMVKDGIPFRMEETNSYCNHGAKGASDAYAAALWGLDYTYWLAAHHAVGLNFMTGFRSPNDLSPLYYSCCQSTYVDAANSTTTQAALGLGYAMAAFNLAAQGKLIQTACAISAASPAFNLSCYAVAGGDGATYVTIINKDNLDALPAVRAADVTVTLPSGYAIKAVQSCQLLGTGGPGSPIAPGDISHKDGITLGGQGIGADGAWTGGFRDGAADLRQPRPNVVSLSVPPASATVLKLSAAMAPAAR